MFALCVRHIISCNVKTYATIEDNSPLKIYTFLPSNAAISQQLLDYFNISVIVLKFIFYYSSFLISATAKFHSNFESTIEIIFSNL